MFYQWLINPYKKMHFQIHAECFNINMHAKTSTHHIKHACTALTLRLLSASIIFCSSLLPFLIFCLESATLKSILSNTVPYSTTKFDSSLNSSPNWFISFTILSIYFLFIDKWEISYEEKKSDRLPTESQFKFIQL